MMKQAMTEAFTRWDAADYLKTAEDMHAYLEACATEAPGDGSLMRARRPPAAAVATMGATTAVAAATERGTDPRA